MKTPLAKARRHAAQWHEVAQSEDSRRGVQWHVVLGNVELGLGERLGRHPIELARRTRRRRVNLSLSEFLDCRMRSIDLDLTPNRGDCFSVLGMARDVAALTGGAALKNSRCLSRSPEASNRR